MKNFYRLAQNMDVNPLMLALKVNAELWNENKLRTEHEGTPHSEVNDIWLRFNDLIGNGENVIDDRESINYSAIYKLPETRNLILWLMTRVSGVRLGRCLITELKPGKKISPHVDMGAPADYYERYHVVIAGHKGSIFRAGDEQVTMLTGDIWWFDNKQEHEVINNSADDRIHMIVDIRSLK